MTFGFTLEKLLLIGLIAALLIGPERLPRYAEALRGFVVRARGWLRSAEGRLRDELGPEVSDVDWKQLDPRRFDPRRIVREALLADAPPAGPNGGASDPAPADDPGLAPPPTPLAPASPPPPPAAAA